MGEREEVKLHFGFLQHEAMKVFFEEQLANGYELMKVECGYAFFEKTDCKNIRYELQLFAAEYDEEKSEREQEKGYLDKIQSSGWIYLGSHCFFMIFKCNEDVLPFTTLLTPEQEERKLAEKYWAGLGFEMFEIIGVSITLIINLQDSLFTVRAIWFYFSFVGIILIKIILLANKLFKWINYKHTQKEKEKFKDSVQGKGFKDWNETVLSNRRTYSVDSIESLLFAAVLFPLIEFYYKTPDAFYVIVLAFLSIWVLRRLVKRGLRKLTNGINKSYDRYSFIASCLIIGAGALATWSYALKPLRIKSLEEEPPRIQIEKLKSLAIIKDKQLSERDMTSFFYFFCEGKNPLVYYYYIYDGNVEIGNDYQNVNVEFYDTSNAAIADFILDKRIWERGERSDASVFGANEAYCEVNRTLYLKKENRVFIIKADKNVLSPDIIKSIKQMMDLPPSSETVDYH